MQKKMYAFVADSTLGHLAKILRLAGFDTLIDPGKPDPLRLSAISGERRIVLTRSERVRLALGRQRAVLFREDRPDDQMNRLLQLLKIEKEDLQPLTRCAVCNQILHAMSKEEVRGRVPDFVWQQQASFKQCPGCQRLYWPGSHAERWKKRLEAWFK